MWRCVTTAAGRWNALPSRVRNWPVVVSRQSFVARHCNSSNLIQRQPRQGRTSLAQRFSGENSVVPPGLELFLPRFPALKRWAKLGRPSGDWILLCFVPPDCLKTSSHAHTSALGKASRTGQSKIDFFGSLLTTDRQSEKPDSAAGSAGSAESAGANRLGPVDSGHRCRWTYR